LLSAKCCSVTKHTDPSPKLAAPSPPARTVSRRPSKSKEAKEASPKPFEDESPPPKRQRTAGKLDAVYSQEVADEESDEDNNIKTQQSMEKLGAHIKYAGKRRHQGNVALWNACLDGQVFLAERAMRPPHSAEVEAENARGWTPLLMASSAGHVQIVRFLLSKKADVSRREPQDGCSALHLAFQGGHLDTANWLVNFSASLTEVDNTGRTCMMFAAAAGDTRSAQWLIARCSNSVLKDVDKNGWGPLFHACQTGQGRVVKWLVKKSVDVDTSVTVESPAPGAPANVFSPVVLAAKSGHFEICELLIRKGAVLLPEHLKSLSKNDAERLQDVKKRLEGGGGAGSATMIVHDRQMFAHAKAVKPTELRALLEGKRPKARIASCDQWGRTALMIAASTTKLTTMECVAFLVQAKCPIDEDDDDGKTALMYAVSSGDLDVAKFLVESHADIHAVDEDCKTLFMYSAESGNKNKAKWALTASGDHAMFEFDNNGWTAAHYAAFSGKKTIVKFLLEKQAEVDHPDNDGLTMLMLAARAGSKDTVQLLLESDADPFAATSSGEKVIAYCAGSLMRDTKQEEKKWASGEDDDDDLEKGEAKARQSALQKREARIEALKYLHDATGEWWRPEVLLRGMPPKAVERLGFRGTIKATLGNLLRSNSRRLPDFDDDDSDLPKKGPSTPLVAVVNTTFAVGRNPVNALKHGGRRFGQVFGQGVETLRGLGEGLVRKGTNRSLGGSVASPRENKESPREDSGIRYSHSRGNLSRRSQPRKPAWVCTGCKQQNADEAEKCWYCEAPKPKAEKGLELTGKYEKPADKKQPPSKDRASKRATTPPKPTSTPPTSYRTHKKVDMPEAPPSRGGAPTEAKPEMPSPAPAAKGGDFLDLPPPLKMTRTRSKSRAPAKVNIAMPSGHVMAYKIDENNQMRSFYNGAAESVITSIRVNRDTGRLLDEGHEVGNEGHTSVGECQLPVERRDIIIDELKAMCRAVGVQFKVSRSKKSETPTPIKTRTVSRQK